MAVAFDYSGFYACGAEQGQKFFYEGGLTCTRSRGDNGDKRNPAVQIGQPSFGKPKVCRGVDVEEMGRGAGVCLAFTGKESEYLTNFPLTHIKGSLKKRGCFLAVESCQRLEPAMGFRQERKIIAGAHLCPAAESLQVQKWHISGYG